MNLDEAMKRINELRIALNTIYYDYLESSAPETECKAHAVTSALTVLQTAEVQWRESNPKLPPFCTMAIKI